MHLSRIEISNIKGIEHQEFAAGALTIIRGPNAAGKSSILDAVRAVFEGGHDPSLIRQGAKKGEVVLTLSDGTTVTKSITIKGQTTTVKTADGQVVPAPMTFVNQLAAGFSFDPLAFCFADHKQRADYLSKVMPLQISREQIVAAVETRKLAPDVKRMLTAEVYDIPALNAQRKMIFDDRAGTNKTVRTLDGTIDTLRKSLPDNWKPEGDGDKLLADAMAALEDSQKALAARKQERDAKVVEHDKQTQSDLSAVDRWEAEQIDQIRLQAASKRGEIEVRAKAERSTIYHSLDAEIEAADSAVQDAIAHRSAIQEQVKHFQKQKETSASLERYLVDYRAALAEAELYTAALEAIDAAKEKALKTSPIPGLSVVDGEVMYQPDGLEAPIPFDQLNRQAQYRLSLKIAAMGAGELGLMVMDNTEAMDDENWREFKDACVESGFQVIAARVDSIETLDIEPVGVAE